MPASVTSRCCLVLSCLVWSHAVVKPNSNYVSQCEHVIHEQEVYVCAADLCKLNLIPRASAVFSLVDEHGCDRKLGFTRRSIFFLIKRLKNHGVVSDKIRWGLTGNSPGDGIKCENAETRVRKMQN